ncbi:hypothetical protein [Actinoplanes cyaneus]|nr:hypothetical protein [Actinoplanes cyaneus]MCW2135487.1 hypothetical protein [Actinoplanes cyaneus]
MKILNVIVGNGNGPPGMPPSGPHTTDGPPGMKPGGPNTVSER